MDHQEDVRALLREARGLWKATLWLAAVTLAALLGLVVYAELIMARVQ